VNPGPQLLLRGDLLQQLAKSIRLRDGEGGAEIGLVLPGDAADFLELDAAGRREPQGVRPAILRPSVTLEQTFDLEIVEQEDEAAREHAEQIGERPLRHVW
jgi:hypothetical protein